MKELKTLLVASLLLFFTFEVKIGELELRLLPAFVSCILIYKSSRNLASYSKHFRKIKLPLILFAIYSAVEFGLMLTGAHMEVTHEITSILLVLTKYGLFLWMLFHFFNGFVELGHNGHQEHYAHHFKEFFPLSLILIAILVYAEIYAHQLIVWDEMAELLHHAFFLYRLFVFAQLDFDFGPILD